IGRIVADKGLSFPFVNLKQKIERVIDQNEAFYGIHLEDEQKEVGNFIKDRLRQFFVSKGIRYDVIDAVIQAEQEDVHLLFESVDTLTKPLENVDLNQRLEL